MLIQEIKNIANIKDYKVFRKFGITIGTVLVLLGIILSIKAGNYLLFLSLAGLVLMLASLMFPKLLRPLYIIWMSIAAVLGFIMSRIILSLVFYLVFAPVGIILRILKKDLLDRKIEPDKESYWNMRKAENYRPEDSEKQY
jgi:hypothetical protein